MTHFVRRAIGEDVQPELVAALTRIGTGIPALLGLTLAAELERIAVRKTPLNVFKCQVGRS